MNRKSSGMLLAVLLCSAAISAGQASTPRRIEIVASKFSFSPNQIALKKGEPVILVLSSSDVTHGLKVKELGINVEIKKGHDMEVPVTPSAAGHFVGRCSHFCGMGHGSMTLDVNVTE
jgi:cytochrome c oxidase subunit 2